MSLTADQLRVRPQGIVPWQTHSSDVEAAIEKLVNCEAGRRQSAVQGTRPEVSFAGKPLTATQEFPRFVIPRPDVLWSARQWLQPRAPICEGSVLMQLHYGAAIAPSPSGEANVQAHVAHVADALEQSRWMLDLDDDWDGEGSPAYSEATWRRAARLALKLAGNYWDMSHERVETPKIHNGPDGSIDLHWDRPKYELLINVPSDPEDAVRFYARDTQDQEIEGCLVGTRPNRWLLMWLRENR
ncbi:MAG: hypothetical protein HY321_20435 [Armatimonadetes bacterium]|nr:hypothetical protein [Armatimonadota bacterium]